MSIETVDVWVVDDDEGMRNSTSFVLGKAGVHCSEFASGADALEEQELSCPQCVVVDFKMPDLNGLEFITQFQNDHGKVPFVLITGHGTVALAVEAMKLGAVTVLEKPFKYEKLIDAVKTAVEMDSERRARENQKALVVHRLQSLTARERQVADLVVEGKLSKQIAKLLSISPKTVEVHRSRITKKMEVESVAQLVKQMQISQL
jgi:FixJ family two-component response regulator